MIMTEMNCDLPLSLRDSLASCLLIIMTVKFEICDLASCLLNDHGCELLSDDEQLDTYYDKGILCYVQFCVCSKADSYCYDVTWSSLN